MSVAREVSKSVVKLYQTNSFQTIHKTVITKIALDKLGLFVRLKETIFHPKGGGQLDDLGTIKNISIKEVHNAPDESEEINHYLDVEKEDCPFSIGETVNLKIDIYRRLQNAALHSAGHVLATLANKRYPQMAATKAHHYPKEARVTFKKKKEAIDLAKKEEIQSEIKKDMDKAINEKMIITTLTTDEGRKIKIGEQSVGCGGTHLDNAGQIDNFSIRNVKIKKDEVNIGYEASPRKDLIDQLEEKNKDNKSEIS